AVHLRVGGDAGQRVGAEPAVCGAAERGGVAADVAAGHAPRRCGGLPVMQAVLDALKESARPTSVTFFLAVIAFGVIVAFIRRTERLARWYFAALFATYWIVASPACAERLVEWRGRGYRPL